VQAPTLETDRLVLRPFSDADAGPLAREIFGDPDVTANLPEDPKSEADQLDYAWKTIRTYNEPWEASGWGGWAVTSRAESIAPAGTLMGFCGFEAPQIEGEGPELGYAIAQPWWGKGLVSEAAMRAVGWLFAEGGHDACHACHAPWNDASGRILGKAGLIYRHEIDLWNSVERGIGLLPFYSLHRDEYLAR
jgi:ribosomal-protein-alanine N-acetyltransferase